MLVGLRRDFLTSIPAWSMNKAGPSMPTTVPCPFQGASILHEAAGLAGCPACLAVFKVLAM